MTMTRTPEKDSSKQHARDPLILAIEHEPGMTHRDYLLAALRCARLRIRLLAVEIDQVGVALKFNMIAPETAVIWLNDIGALYYVEPIPPHGGVA